MAALPGVTRTALNFAAAKLTVEGAFDPKAVIREALQHDGAIARLDCTPVVQAQGWAQRLPQMRMAVSGLLILAGWGAEWVGVGSGGTTPLFAAAMLIGGYATIRQGLRALARLRFDMNGMMTGAVTGAALIGQWEEGATVVIITHRPSVLNSVDKILVLRDGTAHLFGPRDQVLAQFARPAGAPAAPAAMPPAPIPLHPRGV